MNGINIDTEGLGKIADALHTSKEEVLTTLQGVDKAQIQLNEAEASHPSLFVAGWRPAIGWICSKILWFNYVGIWLIEYSSNFYDIPVPERMDMTELWPVMTGMLGLASARSYEKVKGVARTSWSLFKRRKKK